MIFKVNKSEIIDVLQIVGCVVPQKTTINMLSQMMIECDKKNNTIKFTSTDLTIYMTASIKAEVEENISFTIPGKCFVDIIRNFPNDVITVSKIEGVENEISVKCRRAAYKIRYLSVDDYPPKPVIKEKISVTLSQDVLKDMIRKTIYSVSHDESKIYLNGIHFAIGGNFIHLVSTDGHRLSFKKYPLEGNFKRKTEFTLPLKAATELQGILKGEGDVQIIISDNLICFSLENINLFSLLIEERFPNYEQLIEKETDKTFIIPKEEFMCAAHRIEVIVDPQFSTVRLLFKKDALEITGSTLDLGSGLEIIPCENKGEEVEIALDIRYILDVLKNIDTDKIVLEIKNTVSPGIFKQLDDDSYMCIVMPMRL